MRTVLFLLLPFLVSCIEEVTKEICINQPYLPKHTINVTGEKSIIQHLNRGDLLGPCETHCETICGHSKCGIVLQGESEFPIFKCHEDDFVPEGIHRPRHDL